MQFTQRQRYSKNVTYQATGNTNKETIPVRKLISIVSEIKSPEIIRNIIRETLLGNTILVLTASGSFYINSNNWPYLIYIIANPILINIFLTVFAWLTLIIHHYFQELVKHKYTLSFMMFFIWFPV
ncbi:hypothetical protein AU892_28325 [Salmonella enterica subsp. diarizonae]|nr:hypothetical protein [Salmonella enterica subsp. diarizonae]